MSVQEQLSQAQARVENVRSEKDIIKSSEQRLQAEIDSMRRERHTQTMLMANLQAIQVRETGSWKQNKLYASQRRHIVLTLSF